MSRSLQRVWALRDRLRQAAQMELDGAQARLSDIQRALQTARHAPAGQALAAADLQQADVQRDVAYRCQAALLAEVAARRTALAEAKRDARQLELLLEAQTRASAQKATRREQAQLEDWYRSKAHEEES